MSIKPPTKTLPRDLSLREIDAAIARLEPNVPGPPTPSGCLVTVEYGSLLWFLKLVRSKVGIWWADASEKPPKEGAKP